MIVAPDFLDHWRTRMLVDALGGDELAPVYLIRIWAHCQVRRGVRFAMPAPGLKALCKFAGGAAALEVALVNAGFIARHDTDVEVLKWDEYNSQLIAAWKNGKSGGRPKAAKERSPDNPQVSCGNPAGYPPAAQAKAIREDRIREEGIGVSSPSETQHLVGVDDASGGAESMPDCPHLKLLDLFAAKVPTLPQPMAEAWSGNRAKNLRARWRWVLTAKRSTGAKAGERYATTETEALDFFARFFGYVEKSDFLTGRDDRWAGCSRDWLVKDSNFVKVLQGNYENAEQVSSTMAGAI